MIYFGVITLVVVSLALGLYAARNLALDSEGYFIGGRTLNRWAVGISAGATANSGFIVVGAVGMGYSLGLSSLLYPLSWLLGDLLFWFVFSEKVNKKARLDRSVTIPEVLSKDVSMKPVRYLSAIIIFVLLVVYASAQFIASGKALSGFFSMSNDIGMYLTFGIVIGYSIWGGFRSSVWTDLLQGIAMIFLTFFVATWGIYEIGGIGALIDDASSIGGGYTNLLGDRTPIALLVFVIGFAFAGFGFSMSQPQVTTRIMAASSEIEAKKARWIYIGFLHFTWIGMCLIGIITRILIPDLSDGETALPELASIFFHPLFVGFVLAGMLATIFSSLDSLLVSSASALSVDFGFDARLKDHSKTVWYKLSIIITGILSLFLAMYMEATVFQAALFAATVLAASIGAAMTIVVLELPRTGNSIFIAILTGLLVALVWRAYGLNKEISDGIVGFLAALFINWNYVTISNYLTNRRTPI